MWYMNKRDLMYISWFTSVYLSNIRYLTPAAQRYTLQDNSRPTSKRDAVTQDKSVLYASGNRKGKMWRQHKFWC
jgi:hypothetical protein